MHSPEARLPGTAAGLAEAWGGGGAVPAAAFPLPSAATPVWLVMRPAVHNRLWNKSLALELENLLGRIVSVEL